MTSFLTAEEFYGDLTALPRNPRKGSDGFGWILVGILVGVAGLLAIQRFQSSDSDRDRDDHYEERENNDSDDKRSDGKLNIDGGTILFLREKKPPKIEHTRVIDEMLDFTDNRSFGYRDFDDDLPEFHEDIQWAKSKGVEPPLAIFRNADGENVAVIPFPQDVGVLGELFK